MNGIDEKFLPIGTIVSVNGHNRKIMINGFFKKNPIGIDYFDYSGCMYPEGNIDGSTDILFNHSQITAVLYKGMVNEEETAYKARLNEFVASVSQTQVSVANPTIGTTTQIPAPAAAPNEATNQVDSGIAVLDINNIDLTPAPSAPVETSTPTEEAQAEVQSQKAVNYVFGPDGTIIGME